LFSAPEIYTGRIDRALRRDQKPFFIVLALLPPN
jgi:hypothetical protein